MDKEMSLNDAIKHCEEVAFNCENSQCAREHIQLKDWLVELRQYREIYNKSKKSIKDEIY